MPSVTATGTATAATPLVTYNQAGTQPVTVTLSNGALGTALGSIYTEAFTQSVAAALVVVALGVLQEDGTLPNSSSRRNFAAMVLGSPYGRAQSAQWAVAADGATGLASDDATIVSRVLAIWNQLCFGF